MNRGRNIPIADILYKIYQSTLAIDKITSDVLKRYTNLTYSQFVVLKCLYFSPQTSQQEIAEYLHITQPAVSRQIDLLKKKGYITQEENDVDRRENKIILTTSGEKHLKKALEISMKKFQHSLSTTNVQALNLQLTNLLDSLKTTERLSL